MYILLDCTKLEVLKLIFNIIKYTKYVVLFICALIPFIFLIKIIYNLITGIRSSKTKKSFFKSFLLSLVIVSVMYLIIYSFKGLDEYKSNINYCLKYANLENINILEKNKKEVEENKNVVEEEYLKLENSIKEYNKKEISKINSENKNNNETRKSTIITKFNDNKWGNLEYKNGIFYILGSAKDMNRRDNNYGLNPIFYDRLSKMITDSENKIKISIGYRSYDKFLEVWNSSDDDCNTKCDYIINPDSELYSYGISANLYFADEKTKEWAHNNAYKYGLYFKSDDRIEPAKVVYKSYPTCKKLCEVEK